MMGLVEEWGQGYISQDGLDYAAVTNNSTTSVAYNNQGLFLTPAGSLGADQGPYSMSPHSGAQHDRSATISNCAGYHGR